MVNLVLQPLKKRERKRMVYREGTSVPWQSQVIGQYLRYVHYNQTPPFVNSPLLLEVNETLTGDVDSSSWAMSPDQSSANVSATNKARERFVGKLGDASQLGSTLTSERKATWGTIVDGVTNSLLAARAVKKGDLVKAATILGVMPPKRSVKVVVKRKKLRKGRYIKRTVRRETLTLPTGRQVAHSAANNWLWYSYAIQPLVSDIYNASEVFGREIPSVSIKASATAHAVLRPAGIYNPGETYTFESSVRISARVRVANSDLWAANQLGLINPVQMVNEGIPFSFVIDWFSNLSPWIMQTTDLLGLEILEPLTVSKHTVVHTQVPYRDPWGNFVTQNWSRKRTFYKRELSIPSVKLRFAYERFSLQRGLNAVSLLVGFLKKR